MMILPLSTFDYDHCAAAHIEIALHAITGLGNIADPIRSSMVAHQLREIVMPSAKKAAPAAKKSAALAKAAVQATVTLKHLAATLSDSHDLPKKQAEAVLGDLVALATRHLKKGDKIRLTGLGILQVRASGRPGWGATRRPARPSRSRRARRSPSGQPRNSRRRCSSASPLCRDDQPVAGLVCAAIGSVKHSVPVTWGLGRPQHSGEALACSPRAQRRFQRQPDILIGDDKGVVGGRAWMRQSIADRNVGPLSLV